MWKNAVPQDDEFLEDKKEELRDNTNIVFGDDDSKAVHEVKKNEKSGEIGDETHSAIYSSQLGNLINIIQDYENETEHQTLGKQEDDEVQIILKEEMYGKPLTSSALTKIVRNTELYTHPGAAKEIGSEGFMWSWVTKAVGMIDPQAQESLEHISRLLNTLFDDRDSKRSLDAFLALAYIAVKYDTTKFYSDVAAEKEQIIEGHYYFKFACAAYGWKLLNPLMFTDKQSKVLFQGLKVGDPVNEEALCEHTGIQPRDIVTCKWTSSDFHPAHYIALDHSSSSIIIAIRGSFHVKDALVDLIASSVKFKFRGNSGYAHTGMLECAIRKFETIKQHFESTMKYYPDYKVVVVGHSLGAGTASLLTLLLYEEYENIKIHCHAYATPCVLSADLALSCADLITSYALHDDCVPRLSYGSIHLLKLFTTKIMSHEQGTIKLLMLLKSGKLSLKDVRKEISVDVENHLLPPGNMFQINYKGKEGTDERVYTMESSNPTFFYELILSSNMFSDHLPWNYHQAFAALFKQNTSESHIESNNSNTPNDDIVNNSNKFEDIINNNNNKNNNNKNNNNNNLHTGSDKNNLTNDTPGSSITPLLSEKEPPQSMWPFHLFKKRESKIIDV